MIRCQPKLQCNQNISVCSLGKTFFLWEIGPQVMQFPELQEWETNYPSGSLEVVINGETLACISFHRPRYSTNWHHIKIIALEYTMHFGGQSSILTVLLQLYLQKATPFGQHLQFGAVGNMTNELRVRYRITHFFNSFL